MGLFVNFRNLISAREIELKESFGPKSSVNIRIFVKLNTNESRKVGILNAELQNGQWEVNEAVSTGIKNFLLHFVRM